MVAERPPKVIAPPPQTGLFGGFYGGLGAPFGGLGAPFGRLGGPFGGFRNPLLRPAVQYLRPPPVQAALDQADAAPPPPPHPAARMAELVRQYRKLLEDRKSGKKK